MNLDLLVIASEILLGITFIIALWGVGRAWKNNNKFFAFVMLAIAVAIGISFYAIFGKRLFG